MKEFILSALPWIIIALTIAIIVVTSKKEKTNKTYMTEGMSLGMCIGLVTSTITNFDMSIGLCLGMLVGEAIGLSIKKK